MSPSSFLNLPHAPLRDQMVIPVDQERNNRKLSRIECWQRNGTKGNPLRVDNGKEGRKDQVALCSQLPTMSLGIQTQVQLLPIVHFDCFHPNICICQMASNGAVFPNLSEMEEIFVQGTFVICQFHIKLATSNAFYLKVCGSGIRLLFTLVGHSICLFRIREFLRNNCIRY